ncbi:glycosyltransferase family 4 protein [Mesoterricola silvestris]|uniref:Glycosyltransferase n=1 Tax=Mesoterricola silvestris TaxID=2927979 RepID=A0AA48GJE6_9BACT|nr:glycosyltransferase family 4 protein [Mesoterricola silvestris]BDU74096.1 hypothetical protein METEAL_32700 [Mesoterricola silvestris]
MARGTLLYLGSSYHPGLGGAEVTDKLLLESWVASGGRAVAVFWGKDAPGTLRGVEMIPVSGPERMRSEALAAKPDAIYAQFGAHPMGLEIAGALGVPVMTCLHDGRTLCPDLIAQATCDHFCALCPVAGTAPVYVTKAILRQFDRILAPSRYMADLANELLGRDDASVLYPAVQPVQLPPGPEGRCISMAAAEFSKGADLFLRIAERMPDQAFLLSGRGNAANCGYDPRRHPNVRVSGFLAQEAFYGESWLVLMPSRWAEPFGRMGPEAQSAGLLFMGSRVGGLPEAAGEAGIIIDDYLDPDAWVSAIRALQADPARQERLRAMGRDTWKRFEAGALTAQFCRWTEELMARGRTAKPAAPADLFPAWSVPAPLKAAYYGTLAASLLGTLASALGAPAPYAALPLAAFFLCLILLWGLHAGPLLQVRGTSGRRSGIRLMVLGALAVPAALAPRVWPGSLWILLLVLSAIALTSWLHRARVLKDRFRTLGR